MSVTVFNAPAENRARDLHNLISAVSTAANIYQTAKKMGLQKDQIDLLKNYKEQEIQARALQAGYVQDPNGPVTVGDKKYSYVETPAMQQQKFQNMASGAKQLFDTQNFWQKNFGFGANPAITGLRNQAAQLGQQIIGGFQAPQSGSSFKILKVH